MTRKFAILYVLALSLVLIFGAGWVQAQDDNGRSERYVPAVWVDPDGCDHWIIDDGLEGYMSPRLAKDGTPVCSGVAPPNTTTGDFKRGSGVADIF